MKQKENRKETKQKHVCESELNLRMSDEQLQKRRSWHRSLTWRWVHCRRWNHTEWPAALLHPKKSPDTTELHRTHTHSPTHAHTHTHTHTPTHYRSCLFQGFAEPGKFRGKNHRLFRMREPWWMDIKTNLFLKCLYFGRRWHADFVFGRI